MNRYHCFVGLDVRGDALDFDAITEYLQLEPTKTVRKGDRGRVTRDGWLFKVEKEGSTLSELLDSMEAVLAGRAAAVKELAFRHDVYIWCSHQTNLAMSGFTLTPQNMVFLSSLGVRLKVSILSSGEVVDDDRS